ncbi:hydantoinase/oxoprolinase family protein [Spelaeicoccus albus]|uniref:N-methylhydantoinase A n=1 Tax=Spelaeicoccus albus TaxID=1280376 RepID=A0A7Z0A9R7_9MICO|nr:hydantoinase/oxoprolinase family protein [Spelaeicoccus albus]NYI67027.1 N-methylhydantoinase A [Spelaeicoccus albus]
MYRVAMDIGGTFTDVMTYDAQTRTLAADKVLSTPGDLSEGVFAALDAVDVKAADIDYFVHGTTQGLNALLERRGAKILLVTTAGMGDVYQIARGNRDRLFDLHYKKPVPLVSRQDTAEVRGRFSAAGDELVPLSTDDVDAVIDRVRAGGYDSVVVSLLFSYLDSAHEVAIGERLRAALGDDVLVVLSHDVAPEWREYERTSSAALEGYTGPSVHRYLDRIETEFTANGLEVPVHVMQSSGGLVQADFARRHPLQTLLSGPVGGTMGGVAVSRLLDEPNIICADMGGTSFDVSLVIDHAPDVSPDGHVEGFPLLMPMVNLHTVGAGGGSIAYRESSALRVGPQSAGAVPGPACYGNGGADATVTDANCVLGRVNPAAFAGGGMSLDVDASHKVVSALAADLELDEAELAGGICDISNAHMAQAIRTLTVDHGLEPNDFALLAFGGAGPMHAAFIAAEIGIGRVVVPKSPGAFSAWGMLEADIRRDFTRQFFATRETLDQQSLSDVVTELTGQAKEAILIQGMDADRITIEHFVDMRYESQDSTLTISLDGLDILSDDFQQNVEDRFSTAHEQRYGHSTPGAPVQYVAIRTTGLGKVTRAEADVERAAGDVGDVTMPVYFGGEQLDTHFINRDNLNPGDTFAGPAIVYEGTATTVVPPGCDCVVDEHDFILITVPAKSTKKVGA